MCYAENGTVKFLETLADNVFTHNYSMMQIKNKMNCGKILGLPRPTPLTLYSYSEKSYKVFMKCDFIWKILLNSVENSEVARTTFRISSAKYDPIGETISKLHFESLKVSEIISEKISELHKENNSTLFNNKYYRV